MPGGINGWELAAKLTDRRPGLPIIYTSGYNSGIVDKIMDQKEKSFMAKPYTPPQLASMVRNFLDARLKN